MISGMVQIEKARFDFHQNELSPKYNNNRHHRTSCDDGGEKRSLDTAYKPFRGCSHKEKRVIIKEWNYEKNNMSR